MAQTNTKSITRTCVICGKESSMKHLVVKSTNHPEQWVCLMDEDGQIKYNLLGQPMPSKCEQELDEKLGWHYKGLPILKSGYFSRETLRNVYGIDDPFKR